MRILFMIKSMQVEAGGAERVLAAVTNSLAMRGHDISILTMDTPGGVPFYDLSPQCRMFDLELGQPGQSTPRLSLVNLVARIRKVAAANKPDVVVAFMHSMYVPAAFALVGTKIPLVASEHIDSAHYQGRYLEAVLARVARHLAVRITVPALAMRNQFKPRLRDKTVVLSNPVDLTAFEQVSPPPEKPPYVMLAVGRFMDQKNHLELIEAFSRISERFPNWILRIVGDGELRSTIEKKVMDCGLVNRVHLPGAIKDIAGEYGKSQFVVLASLYESFGLVTAEALASSRTVIAFAECTGPAELIEHGVNGYLLPISSDRVAILAEGIANLMSDRTLRDRLAANGPQSVRRFALSKIIGDWEDVLRSTVNRPLRSDPLESQEINHD